MLVGIVLTSVVFSWFAVKARTARRQQHAVEAIGGIAVYDDIYPDVPKRQPPTFLYRLLGRDFFDRVILVSVADRQLTDTHLRHLKELAGLQALLIIEEVLLR